MSSSGKSRTTFSKLNREAKLRETKAAKEARKRERREAVDRAREEGRSPWEVTSDLDDAVPDQGSAAEV